MKQLRFYKYTVLALIALNLLLIAFFLLRRPWLHHIAPHHKAHGQPLNKKHSNFQGEIVATLKLDEQQRIAFKALVRNHRKQMMALDSQHQKHLMAYFHHVSNTDKMPDRGMDDLLQLERKKIETTYKHLQDVKSILREEQRDDFEPFVKGVLKKILPQRGHRKTKRRNPDKPKRRNLRQNFE